MTAGVAAAPGRPVKRFARLAPGAVAVLFLVIYVPDAGRGFISDDFRWIVEGRVASAADLPRVLMADVGFYRPVVLLSFALDYALWGTSPRGYGITNLALCLAAAFALYMLARRLRLSAAAATVAAGVWLFNFHGVNMAVLWLSGRTSLLVSLFALGTAHAMASGRIVVASLMCLLAMLAKEEAVTLPVFFTAVHLVDGGGARGMMRLLPLWAALAIYAVLRLYSGAFWPGSAPAFYQFSFSPALLARNVVEYMDRAMTLGAAVAIVFVVAARLRRSSLAAHEMRALRFGALWIPAMFALTVLLPVRSSLYALLPSIGTALMAGALASAAERAAPVRFARVSAALLVVAVVLGPVYGLRNERWVRLAETSESVIRTIAADASGLAPGHVVLVDAPGERFNLDAAFGALLPEALQLRVGEAWTGEIVAPSDAPTAAAALVYRFETGRLVLTAR